jgi:hypothetical protein
MSRSIDAGRNRGRRLAIPAAIAKNVRADLNIAGLPALWEILHTLVWCDVLKSTAQLKAEAGFEPQVSERPGAKKRRILPDRMMGLAEPAGLRHVRAPAFMFIGPLGVERGRARGRPFVFSLGATGGSSGWRQSGKPAVLHTRHHAGENRQDRRPAGARGIARSVASGSLLHRSTRTRPT